MAIDRWFASKTTSASYILLRAFFVDLFALLCLGGGVAVLHFEWKRGRSDWYEAPAGVFVFGLFLTVWGVKLTREAIAAWTFYQPSLDGLRAKFFFGSGTTIPYERILTVEGTRDWYRIRYRTEKGRERVWDLIGVVDADLLVETILRLSPHLQETHELGDGEDRPVIRTTGDGGRETWGKGET